MVASLGRDKIELFLSVGVVAPNLVFALFPNGVDGVETFEDEGVDD